MPRTLVPLLICIATLQFVSVHAGGQIAAHESDHDKLQRALEQSAVDLIGILEKREPAALLDIISKRGVVFGLEPPPIQWDEVRRQFAQKRGTYCLLFDSECARKEDAAARKKAGAPDRKEPLYSYREMFRLFQKRSMRVSVSGSPRGWGGQVTITFLPMAENESEGQPELINFLFAYERGQWKLTAIVYT